MASLLPPPRLASVLEVEPADVDALPSSQPSSGDASDDEVARVPTESLQPDDPQPMEVDASVPAPSAAAPAGAMEAMPDSPPDPPSAVLAEPTPQPTPVVSEPTREPHPVSPPLVAQSDGPVVRSDSPSEALEAQQPPVNAGVFVFGNACRNLTVEDALARSKSGVASNLWTVAPPELPEDHAFWSRWIEWTIELNFVRVEDAQLASKVVYMLHDSFRENIVTVTEPPFRLQRAGWGFFTVVAHVSVPDGDLMRTEVIRHPLGRKPRNFIGRRISMRNLRSGRN